MVQATSKTPDPWKNKIVGYAEVPLADLQPSAWNWRIHPQLQHDALLGVIREVGLVQDIIVSQRTGTILDGHLRFALAQEEGQATLPVKYVDLSEAEERLVLVTLDPLSAAAEADRGRLARLLEEVQSGESAVQQLLSQLAEAQGLIPPMPVDYDQEWQGMPVYESEAQENYQTIIMHFVCQADVEQFAQLLGQSITEKTKYLYFPAQEKDDLQSEYYTT